LYNVDNRIIKKHCCMFVR